MTFLNDLWASFQIFAGNFTDRYGLWVNGLLLLLVLAAVGLFLWRSIRLGRRVRHTEAQLNLPEPSKKQSEEWCRKLSQAVSFPTVTGDKEAMSQFRSWLKESFPLVFSRLRVLPCPGDGLLFQWRCPEKGEKGPVLLCAHMDVVPTEGQNWTHPPFEGEIKEETVYGRGALDCKGTLCGILQAVEELLQDGFAPGRDVYLAFGCDEETGGKEGAAQIAKQLKMRGLHFDLILDEGTPISTAHLGKENFPAALLGVAEKGQATFRLTARQKAGHAAMPPQHTAAGYLSEAICRIEAAPLHKRLLPVMQQCLLFSAPAMGSLQRAMVANLPFTRPLLFRGTRHNLQLSALFHSTFAATCLEGGSAPNVLPETASALLNARILQGDTGEKLLEYLRSLLDDLPVTIEMVSCQDPSAITDTAGAGYQLVKGAVEETFGRLPCIPTIMPAGTDTKHYQEFSDHIIRFIPLAVSDATLSAVHGPDEHLSCRSYTAGVIFYENLLKKL